MQMKKVYETLFNEFYVSRDRLGIYWFNIIPLGSVPPQSGYKNKEYIEVIKKACFPENWKTLFHTKKEKLLQK